MSLENRGHLEVGEGQGGVYLWLGADSRAYWEMRLAIKAGRGGDLPSEDPQSESDVLVFVFWDNKLRRQSGGRVGAGRPERRLS